MSQNPRTDPTAAAAIERRLADGAAFFHARKDTAEERFQTRCRENLMSDLANRARVLASPPKIFISYSDQAHAYYDQAKAFFERHEAFKAMSWRENRQSTEVNKALPVQIGACSCFLGLWVEPSGKPARATKKSNPSPWMPYELGIARGSGSIAIVLIHEDIDEKFVRDPNPGQFNDRFNENNFSECLPHVERAFLAALEERRPRWTWDTPLDQNYYAGSTAKYWPQEDAVINN